MSFDHIMHLIGRLGGTLKFFPSDPDARIGIAEELMEMAGDEEQVRWLIGRLPKLHKEWPGMLEVRAVFCSKFKPKDGIETYSAVYLDGIPSEKAEVPALPAPLVRQLVSGEPVTSAASIADTIRALAPAKDLNRAIQGIKPPHVPDIPLVKLTDANRITEADMAKAVREFREKAGKEALEVKV